VEVQLLNKVKKMYQNETKCVMHKKEDCKPLLVALFSNPLKPKAMPLHFSPIQSAFRPEDERQLIALAKQDPRHFAPLYAQYHAAIFRYIFRRVEEEELAYDLTSSVFVKALSNLDRYEYRGLPFAAWLFRIAKSELYQSFRDKKSRRTVRIDTIVLKQVMEEFIEDHTESDRQKLVKALQQLKEAQLQLIELRFFEKRSFREIGELLDLSENNAKVKTFRALLKLKTVFNQLE
jgi:RNA polymerase sigma-70 factor (ECF subfamily)